MVIVNEHCNKSTSCVAVQETRGWDENSGTTYSQRLKESSHDYRYFPEPDIPKLKISEIEEFDQKHITKETPELPWVKRDRFKKDFGMTDKEVSVFVDQPEVSKYYETVVEGNSKIIKLATNYILTDYLGLLKKDNKNLETIDAKNFSKLMAMIESKKLSSRGAKDTLVLLMSENSDPEILAEKNGLIQKSDEAEIKKIVVEIVSKNTSVVEDYKKGKEAALQYLVGQGMKLTKGSANPEILKKIILEIMSS